MTTHAYYLIRRPEISFEIHEKFSLKQGARVVHR